jgi:hypothetical protein
MLSCIIRNDDDGFVKVTTDSCLFRIPCIGSILYIVALNALANSFHKMLPTGSLFAGQVVDQIDALKKKNAQSIVVNIACMVALFVFALFNNTPVFACFVAVSLLLRYYTFRKADELVSTLSGDLYLKVQEEEKRRSARP